MFSYWYKSYGIYGLQSNILACMTWEVYVRMSWLLSLTFCELKLRTCYKLFRPSELLSKPTLSTIYYTITKIGLYALLIYRPLSGPRITGFGAKNNATSTPYVYFSCYHCVCECLTVVLQGTWWYKSIKYSGDKILLPTTQLYFYFINKTPNMVFKSKCCIYLTKIMIRWTLTFASCFQNF